MKWMLIAFALWCQTLFAAPIEIQIRNVTTVQGTFNVSLFNSQQSWESQTPSAQFSVPVSTAGVNMVAVNLPPGEYAFFLFQDVNGNNQLEKNFFGRPAEPYAFSNGARFGFSNPTWAEIRFEVGRQGIRQIVDLVLP